MRYRCQRELAARLARRDRFITLSKPIVSFTFDDFPRSALYQGGQILREHGFYGTYYASFGLMGQTAPTGEIFSTEDLPEFVRQGHELACHTFDHCHSWDTTPSEFDNSIVSNQRALTKVLPGMTFRNLSYPISHPRPGTKCHVARHYDSARGGGQTYNLETTDLNYLKAFFIEQSRGDISTLKRVVDDSVQANGWLIFATHDVCDSPTRFGCTPALFENIVDYAVKSGASVLPVNGALQLACSAKSPK